MTYWLACLQMPFKAERFSYQCSSYSVYQTFVSVQNVWWVLPTWFGIPLRLYLHVVLHVKHTPEGYVFIYQEVSYITDLYMLIAPHTQACP
jgi:hypothetical protein